MTNLDSSLKSRDTTLLTKVRLVKAMVFPVVIYGCESWTVKKSWVLKNWCFWTVVLEKTLESPLDCKEIKPVHPKGNQSWIFIGRTEAKAEIPILWPPDMKNWLIGTDPDVGKDWRQVEKGMMEDEMVGWHHQLHGYEFEQAQDLVMDRKACCAIVHGNTKTWTQLSDWTEIIDSYILKNPPLSPIFFFFLKGPLGSTSLNSYFSIFISFFYVVKCLECIVYPIWFQLIPHFPLFSICKFGFCPPNSTHYFPSHHLFFYLSQNPE